MGFRCKGTDDVTRNVPWEWIKGAWLPSITVCNQRRFGSLTAPAFCSVVCEDDKTCVDGECVSILPIVSTDNLQFMGMDGTITGTITSQGASDIIEYGYVWSDEDEPTLDDNVVVIASGAFTGEFEEDVSDIDFNIGVTYYFRVFATNSSGTSYGETLSEMPFICLIKGTQITLANGYQKAIENITYNDSILVWNFDECKFDSAKPTWIAKEFSMPSYKIIRFNDGSELGTIDGASGHSIFNEQAGKFTHLNEEETPIGTLTFNAKAEKMVSLIGSYSVEDEISFYNVITHSHMNLFANGILTSTKLNNLYPIINMKFSKDERTFRNRSEFNVSDDLFEGLRLSEQPQCDKLNAKLERLMEQKR